MNFVELKTPMANDRFSRDLSWIIGLGLGLIIGLVVTYYPNPMWTLLPLAAIFAMVLFARHVHLGLAALIFITYTRFSDTLVHYHGTPSIAQPLIACLIAIALFRFSMFGEQPLVWKKPLLLMLGFLLACSVSLTMVRDFAAAQEGMGDLVKDLFLVMIVIVLLRTRQAFVFSIWALILAGTFLGSIAVFQYLTEAFDADFGGFGQAVNMQMAGAVSTYRISGSIGDPNFFSQIMLVPLPLALNRMLHARRSSLRWLAGWSLVACLLTVFFTFSRGSLLAVFGMIAVMMRQHRPSPTIIITLILAIFVSLPFLPERYLDRLTAIPDALFNSSQSTTLEASLRGRLSEQLSGILMVVDHPLLGVGLKNYPANYQDYAQRVGLESRHTERNAHNMYLEIAAETGIIGGGFFTVILWSVFKSLRAGRKALTDGGESNLAGLVTAYELGVIGYLIAALFLHTAYPRYFWLLAAIAFGISNFASTATVHATQPAKLKRDDTVNAQGKPNKNG